MGAREASSKQKVEEEERSSVVWRVGGEWTKRPRVQVPWMRKRLGGGGTRHSGVGRSLNTGVEGGPHD